MILNNFKVKRDIFRFVEDIARGMNLYPVHLSARDLKNISQAVAPHLLFNHFIKDEIDFVRGYIFAYYKQAEGV